MLINNRFSAIAAPIAACFLAIAVSRAADVPVVGIEQFRHDVLMQNLQIEAAKRGWEVAERQFKAEQGALLEPNLVMSGEYKRQKQENSMAIFRRQIDDRSQSYSVALEQPLGLGGRLSVGYNWNELENQFAPKRENDVFLGVTLVQPLLRNAGRTPLLAMMRIAREESELSFQKLRSQLMQTLASAEAAYWNLYLMQKRVEFRADSVRVSEQILADVRERAAAGRTTELDVSLAEAGLAERKALYLEATHQRLEASNQLQTFRSLVVSDPNKLVQVAEPVVKNLRIVDSGAAQRKALSLHPDYLMQTHRLKQQDIRLGYAANQRLPQLDLKASYGHSGLATNVSGALDKMADGDHSTWSVALQMRIPLGGGLRARNEHAAAQSRLKQETLVLDAMALQLHNEIQSSQQRVINHHEQLRYYSEMVVLRRKLLEIEIQRLEAGQSDTRKVLDSEDDLTEAREAHVLRQARYAVACVEMKMAMGTLLVDRNVEPLTLPEFKVQYNSSEQEL